jgi:regulator of replication initiation timing
LTVGGLVVAFESCVDGGGGWVAVRDLAGRAALQARIAHLEDQNAVLRDEQQRLQTERERLVADNERLQVESARLRETNQRLRAEVEALRQAAKRQAAPFSKGDPTPTPNLPGASRAQPTAGMRTGSHLSASTRS